jgi:5S rRNA maturation endonuclease (ribonuclease M5)
MNRYDEIKNKANAVRDIDLREVLKMTGAVQDRFDKAKWHTMKGVISITGKKFMNWNTCDGGGGAIDLVIHLKNLKFIDAVLWLSDTFLPHSIQAPSQNNTPAKSIFRLPKRDDTKVQRVMNYLINERCIPASLLQSLICAGKLYADTRGNAVFLLLGKEKRIVGAELRGTTPLRWQGMSPGSRKDLGCFYVKNSNTKKVVLCESAIDVLSYSALHPHCLVISTSGANPNPAWLKSLINNNKGLEIYCGFDSDEAGDKLANKMIDLYPTVRRLRPCKKDWNEVLRAKG